jgi:hypothetical protein
MTLRIASSTPLSFVTPGVYVIAKIVTYLVKREARTTNLVAQGYDLKRVGTHSLRALGAMTFKLQGVDNITIMKIGCWPG